MSRYQEPDFVIGEPDEALAAKAAEKAAEESAAEPQEICGAGAGEGMGCGGDLAASRIGALGAKFCPECFKCPTCGTQIEGSFYSHADCAFDTPECIEKYKFDHMSEEEKAALPRCGEGAGEGMGCGEMIRDGNSVGALGAKFCPECFKCPTCQKKIEGSFYGHADCAFDTPECIQIYVDEHGYER